MPDSWEDDDTPALAALTLAANPPAAAPAPAADADADDDDWLAPMGSGRRGSGGRRRGSSTRVGKSRRLNL